MQLVSLLDTRSCVGHLVSPSISSMRDISHRVLFLLTQDSISWPVWVTECAQKIVNNGCISLEKNLALRLIRCWALQQQKNPRLTKYIRVILRPLNTVGLKILKNNTDFDLKYRINTNILSL